MARHATLLTVVHDPALLPLLADRVIGLKQGQLVFDLPIDGLSTGHLDHLYAAADTQGAPHPGTPTALTQTSQRSAPNENPLPA